MKSRRFTFPAKLLVSGLASPALIVVGMATYGAGHAWIGGLIGTYGGLWAALALFVGGPWCGEVGLTTTEYRTSLRAANREIENLRALLEGEKILREKFQAALTDGSERS